MTAANDSIRVPKTAHIHRFSAMNAPVLRVDPGVRLLVQTHDALEGKGPDFFRNNTPRELVIPHANPATGPIFVNGAKPGDAIEVAVGAISVEDRGYLTAKPGRILHGQDRPARFQEFTISDQEIEFHGHRLPVEPMVGVIGTSPPEGVEAWTQEAGDHGGNMDAKIIGRGTTLLLPVFVEGGLLAVGDVHAAMGDGEVFGQGIEVGAEVEVVVSVRAGSDIRRPLAIASGTVATIASHEDIRVAQDLVVRDMGEYLIRTYGLDADEAWTLIALYGDLQFCQVVNPQKTVRMSLQLRHLEMMLTRPITEGMGVR